MHEEDERRRRLARRVRATDLAAFHARLEEAAVEHAFVLYENGRFELSHPELLADVAAFFELSYDFARHEAVFIGREPGVPALFFAFVHDTRRGLSQGGLRFRGYGSLADVLEDGLRLSQGMTRKNALAGLWWGGGKGILAMPPEALDGEYRTPGSEPRRRAFQAYARFVASLGGVYYSAEDVGTKTSDMDDMLPFNRFQTCISSALGGSGNPSPATARGVLRGMQAGWRLLTGSDRLHGVKVAVQGAGNVGGALIEMLDEVGARVWTCDVDRASLEAVRRRVPAVEIVEPDAIFDLDVDVFAPCAIGDQVNVHTIPRLKAKLVCGAANNILGEPRDAERLRRRGIVFVPDYVCNRMGIINCADEWQGYLPQDVEREAQRVYPDTLRVLQHARELGITSTAAADELADVAASELHPLLGHRGRRLVDHLLATGWHRGGGADTAEQAPRRVFVPALDEPELRVDAPVARATAPTSRLAAAPISTAAPPSLESFVAPLLVDVAARAAERLEGRAVERRLGVGTGGRALQLAVERSLPGEPDEIPRVELVDRCRDRHRRSEAAAREALRRLGVSFDPERWLDPMSRDGAPIVERLYRTLREAGHVVEPDSSEEPTRLDLSAARDELRRRIDEGEVSFSHQRHRRRVLEHLEALAPLSISRRRAWGVEHPERPERVLSSGFSLIAWSLAAAGWPRTTAPEPIERVFTPHDLLLDWVVPSQLAALALYGRPAFARVEVHGTLSVADRELVGVGGVGDEAPDEERFLARRSERPMRRELGNAIEPTPLVERFGADALRLGLLLCLGEGEDDGVPRDSAVLDTVPLDEGELRRARRAVDHLVTAFTALGRRPPRGEQPAEAPRAESRALLELCSQAAEEAREALGRQRPATAAELLVAIAAELDEAARRPRHPALSPSGLAAVIERLDEAFSPICPYLFARLAEWSAERGLESREAARRA